MFAPLAYLPRRHLLAVIVQGYVKNTLAHTYTRTRTRTHTHTHIYQWSRYAMIMMHIYSNADMYLHPRKIRQHKRTCVSILNAFSCLLFLIVEICAVWSCWVWTFKIAPCRFLCIWKLPPQRYVWVVLSCCVYLCGISSCTWSCCGCFWAYAFFNYFSKIVVFVFVSFFVGFFGFLVVFFFLRVFPFISSFNII